MSKIWYFYCYSCWNKWNHKEYIAFSKIITKIFAGFHWLVNLSQILLNLVCGMGFDIKHYSHYISNNLDLVDVSPNCIEHIKQSLIGGLINTRYLTMDCLVDTDQLIQKSVDTKSVDTKSVDGQLIQSELTVPESLWKLYKSESIDVIYSAMLIHCIPFCKNMI